MSGIATKVKIGTAASAIALAAVLTPAGIAQAGPVAPLPQAGLGSAALVEDCPAGASDCDSPPDLRFAPNFIASNSGPSSIFQNDIWWFGPANPNPGPRATVFTFEPLSLVPGFLRPLYSWFTQNLNFEACIAGVSVKVGPYGSVTGSIGSHC